MHEQLQLDVVWISEDLVAEPVALSVADGGEVDYPHGDGTWPENQHVIDRCWGHIPAHELRAAGGQNAARLHPHPLPEMVLPW